MARVSVIIPTYNGCRYLLAAVSSALAQSYSDIEVIVVDDGSAEDIRAFLTPVLDRVIYIRQMNSGAGAARNTGIHAAKGTYVAFLDDDDLWLPGNVESLVRLLEADPQCALAYSYPVLIDEEDYEIANERPSNLPSGNVYIDFLKKNRINTTSVTMLRKSAVEDVGFFNEYTTCEDYDLWLRIARKYRVISSDDAVVCYRQRAGSLSKGYDAWMEGHVKIVEAELERDCAGDSWKMVQQAVKLNLYETYRRYAFLYYYNVRDRKKARSCLGKALKIKPYRPRNAAFFLLCWLPGPAFSLVMKVKRLIAGENAGLEA